jgi:hypothetical protein
MQICGFIAIPEPACFGTPWALAHPDAFVGIAIVLHTAQAR